MKITESKGDTEILISKSTRDLVMSDKIPTKCGICNTPTSYLIVGKPGSGKSHFLESYVKKQMRLGGDNSKSKATCFDSIYVVCPESSQSSYDKSFVEDCDPEKVYDELNIANLNEIYDGIVETKEQGDEKKKSDKYFSLLIIDDCASELKDKHVQKKLLKLLRNHRHLHCTIMIVSQNYMAIEKNCRDCIRNLVQFSTTNIKEKEKIRFEWLANLKTKEFDYFWDFLFKDQKFQFLQCDRKTDEIYKTFNKVEIGDIDRTCD